MKAQQMQSLFEAYQNIYVREEVQEEFSEEVEIAAQYFYEMGLNEVGVDILIEELGDEEFAEFVYDIAEEYVLTEARAGGAKIEPKLASGKAIQGKPKAASLKRLRDQKAERKEAESKASESKPSGMKASLQRQSAVAAAAKKQPKKPGLLDRVAGAVNRGIEAAQTRSAADVQRRKEFMSAAKETGKVIRNAAGKVGGVAKEVGRGASGATKLAGHVARKGLSDEYIIGYLIDEGYAETTEAAEAIVVNMSEEWREDIVEAAKDQSNKQIERGVKTTYKAGNVLDNQHQGRSRGLSRLSAGEREEKTKRMRGRLKSRRDDLFGERNRREDEARAEMKKKYGL
jgi:hypothetical protein